MPKGKTIDMAIDEAEKIVRMWEANPTFSLGEIKLADFKAAIDELRQLQTELDDAKAKVTRLVVASNDKAIALIKNTSRALSGTRAIFGPDSAQYKEAGGTRQSEHKTSKKKKS